MIVYLFRIQLVRADDCLALNADYKTNTPGQDPFDIRGPLAQLQGQSTRYVLMVKVTRLIGFPIHS